MSDPELVLRARGGDELAFRRLVDRHNGLIHSVASSYYLPGGTADDLCQEGLWGFHKAVRDYKPDRNNSFSAFAFLCVRRQVVTAVKMATAGKHQALNRRLDLAVPDAAGDELLNPEEGPAFADADADPLHRLVQQEDWDEVRQMCRSLSPLEHEALGLYLSDLAYDEIAERIGCSYKTVDNALQRVTRKVRRLEPVAA